MSHAEQAFILWVASHANERGHNRYTQEEKAALIAGAKWAQAEAWEEGCEAGMAMAAESFWRPDNPYRRAADPERSNR